MARVSLLVHRHIPRGISQTSTVVPCCLSCDQASKALTTTNTAYSTILNARMFLVRT